ncbi:hypothetical protein GE061_014524 [Apolygus lucorum]|uniref:Odorant receptor n=1 Tax=Apolygus lucorum TaxID=248454 RepID=A0A6A4JGS3_APOLU|nr:hypothetical protein GE061_014524 [Apolygus lucorum]
MVKLFDELAEQEDEELMGVYKKLYGPALQLSLLFPSWKRENLYKTFGIILVYTVTLLVHFYVLSVSVVMLRDDFEAACLAFHYWLIFLMVFLSLALINKDRRTFSFAHRCLARDMGNYAAGRIYSESKPLVLEARKKKELFRFLVLPGMVVILAAALLIVPYLKKINNPPHYSAYGVNMNLPIATHYPFPTDHGIIHGVVVLGQLSAAFSLAVIVVSLELLLFRVSQAIIFEFKILQYALKTLFERSERLFFQLHPDYYGKLSHMNSNYQKCITRCIQDCVKHHYKIQELLQAYEYVLKWPAALGYGIGTGVIGLGLVTLLMAKEKGNLENVVIFSLLIVAEVLNMYIVSVFGEDITTESAAVRDELYFIDWYKLNIPNRRMMLNFQVGITNPVIVKAGGLVALCMDTFSSIMNTSYSFFNLMNANPLDGNK